MCKYILEPLADDVLPLVLEHQVLAKALDEHLPLLRGGLFAKVFAQDLFDDRYQLLVLARLWKTLALVRLALFLSGGWRLGQIKRG